jgi:amino acid adenylation domain-containing protein
VCFEDQRLTYAELDQRANEIAHRLRALGVERNVSVGLCLDRSLELVVSILGILKAGGGYVPIDPAYPAERRGFILEDAQTPVLVTDRARAADFPAFGGTVLLVDDPPARNNGHSTDTGDLDAPSSPEDLAYIIYTSGSTGRPKGTEICHRHVVRLFEATSHWFGFGEKDVWTLFHSAAFDFSVWELWGALLNGGRLVVVPYWVSRAPDAFLALLAREQVTVLNQTPSAFQQLMEADHAAPGSALSLRLVIFGGEALDLGALRPWVERHGDARPQLVNMYGITETTVHVTYRPITARDIETGAGSVIGVPIPDLQVYLLDTQLEPVPFGIVGEIYVGGAGVGRGYLRRPDLDRERFLPDPWSEDPGARLYRSGDLARRNADGELVYLGRIDDQIKIRGFRIELGEIESALASHPALARALVTYVDDPPAGRRLIAYVVSRDAKAAPPTSAELRRHLSGRLPDYMVPASFVVLERFPLTTNGKIDRRGLPAPEMARSEAREVVAPRTETEARAVRLFADVVGRPTVSVLDSFFELGGHSMLAVALLTKLRAAFGVEVQLRSLFERPTVAGIAEVIDGLRWHQQELTVGVGAARDEIEL